MKSKTITATGVWVLIFVIFLSGCTSQPDTEREGWNLVWNDEFTGRKLNTENWDYQLGTGSQYGLDGWGNQELQYYTKENISVKKGMLIIEAKKEDKEGKPFTSGRIRTMKDDGTILFVQSHYLLSSQTPEPFAH